MGHTPRAEANLGTTNRLRRASRALLTMLAILAMGCGSGEDSKEASSAWRVADGRLVGSWEDIAVAAHTEIEPGLVVMDNNTRLVAVRSINGGYDLAAYVYDSSTGTATPATPSGVGWRGATTVVWTGERVLVIGGASGTDTSPAWPAYDPVADVWDELVVDPAAGRRAGRSWWRMDGD